MTPGVTLTAHRVTLPLVRPFVTAVRRATALESVLVEARDDDGRSGWGEAPISRVTRATSDGVCASVEGPLQDLVRSGSPTDALHRVAASTGNTAARMAVDCALHDLAAQQAGMSLLRYLGGSSLFVTTDMTLSVGSPAALSVAAREHVAAGFGCLKVKVDGSGDPVSGIAAVRAAVGPAVTLRVDANQAFSADDAVRFIRDLEDRHLDVEFVEQPVRAHDWVALAHVTRHVSTPVMADESLWNLADLHELLRHEAAPMVNIKLAKTGGLLPALGLAAAAREAGLRIIVGCMMESTVGIGAAAAFASALGARPQHGPAEKVPVDPAQDLDGGLWPRDPAVGGGVRYDRSRIGIADRPGLGITGLRTAPRG
ncbi:dipeptide epimerase [Arthrobacter sp. L77]|uniref:dipeptide epimerase n=1 Tax=Arthrobacter sp. L77 TaxID=1496689 RepID=UPI0005BE52D5|nr:dipeptide epimerase [Arthrobacter sp. L77]